MASVFKRTRWVDGNGKRVAKGTPGAKQVKSKTWTVQLCIDGRRKLIKGYTDRQASLQLGAKLERQAAQGEQGLADPYKLHRNRTLAEHIADWAAELRQLGRDGIYIGLCESRMNRMAEECGWDKLGDIAPEAFIRW